MTPQRQLVYNVIRQHIAANGYPPTLAELCTATGTASIGSMFKHVRGLEKDGLVKRGKGGWRDLTVEGFCPCCGQSIPPF